MKILRLSAALMLLLLLGIFSCKKDNEPTVDISTPAKDFSAKTALSWFELLQEIDRYSPGYRPPAAARMLAYIGLAGYEAAVPGMPEYNSLQSSFTGLSLPTIELGKKYHWPTAVNAAYHAMFVNFYPHIKASDKEKIEKLSKEFEDKYSVQLSADIFSRSKTFGADVAAAVYNWSKTDAAGHEAFLNPRPASYVPPVGPGLWQPTWPDYTPALFPYWGQVRPFAMSQADLLARPPVPWSDDPNSQIHHQAQETQVWVDKIKAGQDDEAKWIAEFWSDDFAELTFEPAVRQVAIANQIIALEGPSLETAVELYAKIGMALCDVGIAVWKSKYVYNYERPIHYIRRNFDPNWSSILDNPLNGAKGVTPEFPTYPSGHSGFAGAGAGVLSDIFGNNYSFTDNCHKGRTEFRGEPRSFNTFLEAATENAYSRVPLGVHFRMDCDEGLRQGFLAAKRVVELPWKK